MAIEPAVPIKAVSEISEDDVQQALVQLKASEPMIEKLPEPQLLAVSGEKPSSAQQAAAKTMLTTSQDHAAGSAGGYDARDRASEEKYDHDH